MLFKSRAIYETRRDACTAQALGELVNDPEYKTWALRKAKREQRQLAVSNVLVAAAFALFCLSIAYCKPGATVQVTNGAGDSVQGSTAPDPVPRLTRPMRARHPQVTPTTPAAPAPAAEPTCPQPEPAVVAEPPPSYANQSAELLERWQVPYLVRTPRCSETDPPCTHPLNLPRPVLPLPDAAKQRVTQVLREMKLS